MNKLVLWLSTASIVLMSSTTIAGEQQPNLNLDRLKLYSQNLNMTLGDYLHAMHQFSRLELGTIKSVPSLYAYPEVTKYFALSQQNQELDGELNERIKQIVQNQHIELSNLLGLTTDKLQQFVTFYQNLKSVYPEPGLQVTNVERITITCDADCQRQAQQSYSFRLMNFMHWASNADVPRYTLFNVEYLGGALHGAIEAWSYSEYSGAYYHSIVRVGAE